jgi:hypothetical protein
MAYRFTLAGAVDSAFGTDGVLIVDDLGGQPLAHPQGLGVQPGGQLLVGARSGVVRMNSAIVEVPRAAGAFVSLPPARILDTRVGNGAVVGKVPGGGVLELQVVGRGGVPVGAADAVVLNVTVTEPTAAGYVTVFPTGTAAPLASNLNFAAGQTIPNLVTVKLGTDGKVSLRNGSAQGIHLIADVAGFYADGEASVPGAFAPLDPARLLDTRTGTGAPGVGKVAGQGVLNLQVTGRGGVPATGVAAAVLTVTVAEPTASGFVTAFPAGVAAPLASNLNFTAGTVIANLVTVKVGDGGQVSLRNGSAQGVHLIADIAGYYLAGTATEPGTFVPLEPARMFDTRVQGHFLPWGVPAFSTFFQDIAGVGGVPAEGADAVVLNLTAVNPLSSGYLTAFPTTVVPPVASNLNFTAGQVIPNLAIVKLSGDDLAFRNGSPAGVHVVADVAGYFIR